MATFKSKKRVWITGENGFIGKNIIENFSKDKYEILSTNRKDLDLNNYDRVKFFLKKYKPNVIINTAGLVGGIIRNKKEKYELLVENLKSSVNLIDQVYKNYNNEVFLNLSSSCIYPNNLNRRIKENKLNLKNIESSSEYYALSKIISLKICKELHDRNFKFYSIIPSNLFGKYDDFSIENGHVIGSLINKFFNNQNDRISLLGSGIAKRDFLFIDDFTNAIEKLISYKKLLNYPYYNLSSNRIISIKQLSILIRNLINKKIKITFNNDGNDGTLYKSLDSNLFRKSFNWKEKNSLDKGLKQTINFYLNENYKLNNLVPSNSTSKG